MKKNKSNQESREFWNFIEETSQRVSGWPSWMRGESHRDVHVIPNPDGKGWVIQTGGEQVSQHRTKADAVACGRDLARTHHAEHVIHSQDGRIVQKNSYGNDPMPPKTKKR